ncbi:hypothetical protein PQ469_04920 [Mucilaginibacter sp. KACC 22773]|uniref:hypothetical protein n=1 Tax=Mucilaginibacter sp. KACC 22773 TaxID=3025671 RepID=UPI0023664647|nr:hypothetical protein [Mucilaginibacter sp. KACC 22773]WDF79344.1 hypothetical protein PQ469_04920 [Mucilaginibacter sp. KACC 22773]
MNLSKSVFNFRRSKCYSLAVVVIYSFISTVCVGQSIGTDSRGKDIFDYYQTKSLSIPVSTSSGSFKLTGTSQLGNGTQYFVSPTPNDKIKLIGKGDTAHYSIEDKAKLTYATSLGLIWSLSVDNIKSDLSKVSTFHPTYGVSVGIGHNVDIFNNWENVKSLSNYFIPVPWNVNVYGKLDNTLIYDKEAAISSRQKPVTLGFLGEVSFFPANAIVVSGSVNIERGNNISTLKNYQANTPFYSNKDIISLGDYVGKLGDLKKINNYRYRVSVAFITDTLHFITTLQPCFIPYYNYYGQFNGKSNNMFGVFFSLLGKAFYGQNNTNIVSGAGVGIDWTHNSVWSHSIFVAGSVNLSSIFVHKAAIDAQKTKAR